MSRRKCLSCGEWYNPNKYPDSDEDPHDQGWCERRVKMARRHLEALMEIAEGVLGEHMDNMGAEERGVFRAAIQAAKEALEGT